METVESHDFSSGPGQNRVLQALSTGDDLVATKIGQEDACFTSFLVWKVESDIKQHVGERSAGFEHFFTRMKPFSKLGILLMVLSCKPNVNYSLYPFLLPPMSETRYHTFCLSSSSILNLRLSNEESSE